MSIFQKPEVTGKEAIAVFFHSIWAMIYHTAKWGVKNFHRFAHLLWAIGFAIVFYATANPVFAWLAVVPAIAYAFLWAVGLRKIIEDIHC